MKRLGSILVAAVALLAIVVWLRREPGNRDASSRAATSQPAASEAGLGAGANGTGLAGQSLPSDSVPLATSVSPRWIHTFDRLAYGMRWEGVQPVELEAFREWTTRYLEAGTAEAHLALEQEGVTLARARRPVMRALIASDPARAIGVTVPTTVRSRLPAAVVDELETRVGGVGDFAVVPIEPAMLPGSDTLSALPGGDERFVYLNGTTYTAHAYGRRRAQLTEENASLHGIAIDQNLAVHESPLRLLDPGELPGGTLEPLDPVTGLTVDAEQLALATSDAAPTLVAFNGRWWALADPETVEVLEQRLHALEQLPGPKMPRFEPGTDVDSITANAVATGWTTGTKRLLVIRVDFSDVPGQPVEYSSNTAISQASAQNVINGQVRTFFESGSYNKTSLTATASSKVYRMPKSAATYATNRDLMGLHNDAKALAKADYEVDSFDLIQIVFSHIGPSSISGSLFTFAGVAYIGGSQSFLNGTYDWEIVAHELGHNYGLAHANLWQSYEGTGIGESGYSVEYGDDYDIMGGREERSDQRHHFNPWFKNRLGWLPDGAVTTVTSSGTYRVHRFDSQSAPLTHALALHIFRDGCRSYWVGHRRNFTNNTGMSQGAYVTWGFYSNQQSLLLDLNTPGYDLADVALSTGGVLADEKYGVTLRHGGRGGTSPSEYVDIEVTVEPPARNLVAQWGEAVAVAVPSGLRDVVAIAAGDEHGLALTRDGSLVTWGEPNPEGPNQFGELSIPWEAWGSIASIAAGGDVSGVVKTDGSIVVWGDTRFGQTAIPAGLSNVKQLALGGDHAVALKQDGTVVAWGNNERGQASVPAGLSGVKAVSAGRGLTLVLLEDGTVLHWGVNATQKPASLGTVVAVSAGWGHALALKSDGIVVAWGANESGQSTVPSGLKNVKQIGAGAAHSVALRQDGTIVAWGSDDAEQRSVPRGLRPVDTIAVAENHTMALVPGTNAALIISQPQDQQAYRSTSAYFWVDADSPTNPVFQWQRKAKASDVWTNLEDGELFEGVSTRWLQVVSTIQEMDGDQYRCVVSNASSHVVASLPVTLTVVNPPIEISGGPDDQTVQSGNPITFWVSTPGYSHLTYRWQYRLPGSSEWQDVVDGPVYDGATSHALVVTPQSFTMSSTRLRCWVGDGGYQQERVSRTATLTVTPRQIAIIHQPADQEAAVGSMVAFGVVAEGEGALTYQWQRKTAAGSAWEDIVGARASVLQIPVTTIAGTGDAFRCAVGDEANGAATSSAAVLRVTLRVPSIVTRPARARASFGGSAVLSAEPQGTPPFTYQWRHDGRELPGQTGSTLMLEDLDVSNEGFYDVVITASDGVVSTSRARKLSLVPDQYPNALRVVPAFAPSFELEGGSVHEILTLPDGGFYVAGDFAVIDGARVEKIARFRNDGELDDSFVPPAFGEGVVYALALQSNGKLLAGGWFGSPEDGAPAGMIRLNADGSRDPTFDVGSGPNLPVHALALQNDGRIIAGGSFGTFDGHVAGHIVRLNTDGGVDETFASGSGAHGHVASVVIDSDDKILVGGSFYYFNDQYAPRLVRLSVDGTLDPSFSVGTGPDGSVTNLLIQPDGRLIVGGDFTVFNGVAAPAQMVRLAADGSRELPFAPATDNFTSIMDLALQGTNIIVAGYSWETGLGYVVRLREDGGVDSGFGLPEGFDNAVHAVACGHDGTVFVGGVFTKSGEAKRYAVASLIGFDGSLATDWHPSLRRAGEVRVVRAANGGKWLVGGAFTHLNDQSRRFLARLNADGTPDEAFDPGNAIGGTVESILHLHDGSILVGLSIEREPSYGARLLVRLNPDGSKDETLLSSEIYGYPESTVSALAMLPDGEVLSGGLFSFSSPLSHGSYFARTTQQGQLSPGWNTGYSVSGTRGYAVLARSDGRVVVAGDIDGFLNAHCGGVLRLNRDGSIDATFDPGRGFRSGNMYGPGHVFALAEQGDGKIIAAGDFTSYDDLECGRIARMREDGSRDEAFRIGSGFDGPVYSLVAQADGRTLAGGRFTTLDGTSAPLLMRLESDGSRDARFHVNGLLPAAGSSIRSLAYAPDGRLLAGGTWLEFTGFDGRGLVMFEASSAAPELVEVPPETRDISAGAGLTLSADVAEADGVTYQWQLNGVNIHGATSRTLVLPSVQGFHEGVYTLIASNDGGSITSNGTYVEVAAALSSTSRLLNLSTRALGLSGEDALIPGFVLQGSGTKRLLLRAVGPQLSEFGVAGAMPDPQIVLKRRVGPTFEDFAANSDWGLNENASAIVEATSIVGAFDLEADGKDAALLVDLEPGEYTVVADDAARLPGIAMVEVYDAADAGVPAGPRLVNLSNRGYVGTGADVMIPGFVVSTEGAKTVLLRAVGPQLEAFGVTGVLEDPRLVVYRRNPDTGSNELILSNDNWGENNDATDITATAAQVGAFPLDPGSKDAAFVITLQPGVYTVHASGADGGTGVALVEVYVVE